MDRGEGEVGNSSQNTSFPCQDPFHPFLFFHSVDSIN